jgi:hypothetical protein
MTAATVEIRRWYYSNKLGLGTKLAVTHEQKASAFQPHASMSEHHVTCLLIAYMGNFATSMLQSSATQRAIELTYTETTQPVEVPRATTVTLVHGIRKRNCLAWVQYKAWRLIGRDAALSWLRGNNNI